jgi:hypothetical protein
MKKERMIELLPKMFKRDERERLRLSNEFFSSETTRDHAVLIDIVGNTMLGSKLSADIAYEVTSRALNILAEVKDWENKDAIEKAIDRMLPVRPVDIMKIYLLDWQEVDKAEEEYGREALKNSKQRAMCAWSRLIRLMVEELKKQFTEIIE